MRTAAESFVCLAERDSTCVLISLQAPPSYEPPAWYTVSIESGKLSQPRHPSDERARSSAVEPDCRASFSASTHAFTVSSGLAAGAGLVGEVVTLDEELVADELGSEMSGLGSPSEHAPSRQPASRVASAQRVRYIRVLPEKENLDRKLPPATHRRDPRRRALWITRFSRQASRRSGYFRHGAPRDGAATAGRERVAQAPGRARRRCGGGRRTGPPRQGGARLVRRPRL